MSSQPDDTEAGGVDPDLKLLLLQHDLDESRHTNLRLRQSLLAPPYAQLRSLLRRHPGAAAPIIKALNVVSGTGTINVHRRALARLQLPRDLRDVRDSGFFDAEWYATVYPEVGRSGMDPLRHFVRAGAARGFDPGPRFSTGFYVDHTPDAAGRDTNALLHYVRFGRARGNQIAPSTMDRQWLTVTMHERFPNLRPLRVYEAAGSAPRISMVTDSISSGSLFGGVGTALIFSTLLAARMGRPLRVITRAEPPTPSNFRAVLEANGIEWTGNVDFVFSPRDADSGRLIDVTDRDLFVTTSWWTTWATRAVRNPADIIYIVQEDERRFYPEGDESLRCAEVLDDPQIRYVVNSKLLFDHLWPSHDSTGEQHVAWFEPAFPAFRTQQDGHPRGKRKFIFYARPNNLRNLYFRGLEAISSAIECGTLDPDAWEFFFIGKDLQPATLPCDVHPELIENLGWQQYHELLRRMDLGLSLMASPHPSYPPLDMAAAGAVVVTNTFGAHRRSLDRYSKNIIACDPDVASLTSGIARGAELAGDLDRRRANHRASTFAVDWHQTLAPVCEQLATVLTSSEA